MKRYQDYRCELKYPLEKYEFIHFKSISLVKGLRLNLQTGAMRMEISEYLLH